MSFHKRRYTDILMDKFDEHGLYVLTYTHLKVQNGWVTQVSVSMNTDMAAVTAVGYDRNLNESMERAAKLLVGQLSSSYDFGYYKKKSWNTRKNVERF